MCRKAVPLIDVNTYLTVQQVNRDLITFSRRDAQIQAERVPAARIMSAPVRHRLSRSLRRLAEVIQPDGTVATVPLPTTR
jgi:hypothetical protein